MRIVPDIYEFFVEGGNQDVSHALLHITEPSTPEEEKKGYFFALAEIEHATVEQVAHLQKLIDDLESGYYETDAVDGKDPFEVTLEFINRRGHHILQNTKAKVHCFASVVRGTDIVFAYHGSPNVSLFYRSHDTLEHTSVLEGEEDEKSGQLFSSILQGAINPGDFFTVTTPHVMEYFTVDRLLKILSSRPGKDTAAHIEKVLQDLRNERSFAGVIISLPVKRFALPAAPKKSSSDIEPLDSVTKLVNAEKTTDELLSPSFFGDTRKKLQTLIKKSPEITSKKDEVETNYRPGKKPSEKNLSNTVLIALGKALVIGTVGIAHALKNIFIWFVTFLRNIFYFITNIHQKRRDTIAHWKRTWRDRRIAFRSLPLLSKLLFVGTAIFVVLLIGTVRYLGWKTASEAQKQAVTAAISKIRSNMEEAEGSMIYGNTDKAFTLLQEANAAISTLPEKTDEEKQTRAELASDIDNSLRKIRKFVPISPAVLFNLAQLNPNVNAEKLIAIDDTLIAYGPNDARLYRVDLNTTKGDTTDHSTIATLHAASTPKENDKIVFVSGNTSVAEYDKKTGGISAKDISFPTDGVQLADVFVYNQRLYSLDAGGKHIYRHSRTQTGYDQGSEWSKTGQDELGGATSLSIDGDVYVLTASGIEKFVSGNRQAFPIIGLDPPLDHPAMIWTYNDVNNIYILEPTNKRVIVLSKEGKLLAQYTSLLWKNPTGMMVQEDKKTIYVLDSNTIYQFSI